MLFVGQYDQYFMVQWFFLVYQTLSNRKASSFGYLFNLTLSVILYYLKVTLTYIFMYTFIFIYIYFHVYFYTVTYNFLQDALEKLW